MQIYISCILISFVELINPRISRGDKCPLKETLLVAWSKVWLTASLAAKGPSSEPPLGCGC